MSTGSSLPFCPHGRMLGGKAIVNRRASRRSAAVFISSLSLAWNAGTLTLQPANCNAKTEFSVSQAREYQLGAKRTFPTRAAVPKTNVAAVLICTEALVPASVVLCSHLHSDNA